MSDRRVWYRSFYWRIALGYMAVLALLLVVQGGLAVWLTNRLWGRASRTPAQLAEIVGQDLSSQLGERPDFDVGQYLRQHYGLGYQPFVVVFVGDRQVLSNRPTAIPRAMTAASTATR